MLLAFGDRIPNQEAIALSSTLGWWMLAGATSLALAFVTTADRWRAWWLAKEDPRAVAMFRIVFTAFLIANINGMWECFEFLYTDEGIFTADVARQVFAARQFEGFGDGLSPDDPWGFFDATAVWTFLAGPKYSLLFFWDSPSFFWGHLVAFWIAAGCLLVGLRTRLSGVLTWFLMNSILTRNHLGWEGTELVYRCFLVYLVVARSGHAYSVDNWLRCRRLRRQGRLSEPDGPGGGAGVPPTQGFPDGLEAIYRSIPAWPRRLMMLQLATIYITTGTLKSGAVWLRGDALYYALNLDHFYRLPPQYLSSLAGTTVFRGMTWAVKIGQTAFPLVLVGLISRWVSVQNFPPLRGGRKWGFRLGLVGLFACSAVIIHLTWPLHFTPPIRGDVFAWAWFAGWLGLWALWSWLGRRDRDPRARFDRDFVCRWIIGRRVLLVWHLAFHAHIFTLMNVGQFQTAMLSATLVFLEGREIATLLRDIGHRLGRWRIPGIPASVAEGQPIVPSEDPALSTPRRIGGFVPVWALAVGLAGIVAGVCMRALATDPWFDWRWVWVASFVFVAGVQVARGRIADRSNLPAEPARAWAYGPWGRLLVSSLVVWHLAAVATWLLPDKDCFQRFHRSARGVFTTWLTVTTTDQGWGMFAPNPPRTNVFLKVLVTDPSGEVWDLKTDVYDASRKPIPWIWNTRTRKINRRIIGGESGPTEWYRKWHARYHCRRWALTHGGEMPRKVDLVKVWYTIPPPEQTHQLGYYVAEELLARAGHEQISHTEVCRHTVMGQLPDEIRARHGLPPLPAETPYRVWHKHRKRRWEAEHGAR